ncbi:MAG: hypothetical protein VKO39_07055 [Cyanobacteriota bacterium]|nr:hypothetical protein [Cyanobacteriota bacterium]
MSGIFSLFTAPLLGIIFLYLFISVALGILPCFDLLWQRASGRKKLYAHLISQWLILFPSRRLHLTTT